jgi:acetyl-CoA carboxylase carboxyltransferase component
MAAIAAGPAVAAKTTALGQVLVLLLNGCIGIGGAALGLAGRYELDDVIDPADTRETVIRFLVSLPPLAPRTGRKRTIDNW